MLSCADFLAEFGDYIDDTASSDLRAHLEDHLVLGIQGDLFGLEGPFVLGGLLHLAGHGDGQVLSHLEGAVSANGFGKIRSDFD